MSKELEAIIRKEMEKITYTHYEPKRTEDINNAMKVISQALTKDLTMDYTDEDVDTTPIWVDGIKLDKRCILNALDFYWANRPPTAEQLCEELGEELKRKVYYDTFKKQFYYKTPRNTMFIVELNNHRIIWNVVYGFTPSTSKRITQFYEAGVKE